MIADASTLERLEWRRLQTTLAERPRTPMGRERADSLLPDSEAAAIDRVQARVEEMRRLSGEQGRLPITATVHPDATLDALNVAGRTLPAIEIYDIVQLLVVARQTAVVLRGLDHERYPELGAEWARFPDLEPVIGPIEGNITSTGHIEDTASPDLMRIRREIRHLSERLTRVLEGLMKADWTGPVLRDQYYTVRNNRFVVPVRTDTPRRFPGIVHGHSSTDKTMFVEPLETVDINNDLVRLAEEEESEIERILSGYTELLRAFRGEIETAGAVLGEIDLLEAIAGWADAIRAVRPDLVEGGGFKLEDARHPLLEESLAAVRPPRKIVPLTLDLPRETRALVISGPNAGGKTVGLKTIGLLTLMAHAGLPVPASEARVPVFSRIYADIGDEQSISESLSTFSSHVRNLAVMVRGAAAGTLALIDEIGTGTDPAEGAALGMAVMERLMQRGAQVVVTTHHQGIKTWGYRTPGALNAAADFDEHTLRPTFRLVTGVAGASIGLTMAEQLGLDASLVEAAQLKLDPAGADAARALDAVRSLAADLERQREEAVALRRKYEADELARQARWRTDEERRREQWSKRIDDLSRSFRSEADKLLSTLTDVKERRAVDKERAARERALREQFSEELRAARRTEPAPESWTPQAGETVFITSLGREGVVRRLDGQRVDLQLGRALFSLKLSDLRPAGSAVESIEIETDPEPRPASVLRRVPELPQGVRASVSSREVPRELNLIGQRVDEAIDRLDHYLDDALLAGLRELRIVHGFGTGALKRAVRARLAEHPEVLRVRDGLPEEGGGGATVAVLESE
ncbi:MAG: Smr/MutS family protein [Acidobacteriota bacterium]